MIDLLIAILIAMSTNTACDLGEPVDWYSWANSHSDAYTIASFETDEGDFYVYHSETDNTFVLFVFKDDVSDTIAAGGYTPHGKCAQLVTP